ncbi:MAG: hypothetical protein HZB19_11095 [Chloroflexi bacterium]|nr:hypothetical protein [Chloroflexota bacterium]
MTQHDVYCQPNRTPGRTNYIQHFWQDSGYASDGATINKNAPTGTTFNDVLTSHWAYYYIEPMYQVGIMDPIAIQNRCTTYRFFCPDYSVRRDEMAYFLERGMRGSNYQFPAPTGIFSDVPTYYWNAAVIEQLYADGITAGCYINPLRYCPGNGVTRAEMAVFLLKAEHGSSYLPPPVGSSTGFADVPVTHWAAAWIKQLYAEGITGGCSINPLMYCPNNWTSRAEMAVFLQRTFIP